MEGNGSYALKTQTLRAQFEARWKVSSQGWHGLDWTTITVRAVLLLYDYLLSVSYKVRADLVPMARTSKHA